MEAAVRIKNLSRDFGRERVLHGVTRDFEAGRIHGIVGNNGSGKTVLMKCICGFLPPTEGEVIVGGLRVGRDVDFPPDLGAIIETPGFLPALSGVRNLEALAALNRRVDLAASRAPSGAWGSTRCSKSPWPSIRWACGSASASRRRSWRSRRC